MKYSFERNFKALSSRLALFLKNVALIQAMTAVSRQIEIDNNRNVHPHPRDIHIECSKQFK